MVFRGLTTRLVRINKAISSVKTTKRMTSKSIVTLITECLSSAEKLSSKNSIISALTNQAVRSNSSGPGLTRCAGKGFGFIRLLRSTQHSQMISIGISIGEMILLESQGSLLLSFVCLIFSMIRFQVSKWIYRRATLSTSSSVSTFW